jgi:hypothetical protein
MPDQPAAPSADESADDGTIQCEGHGTQPSALVCLHLVEAEYGDTELGFNWSADEGEFVANCDACELECDDEGYFPDDLVEETFVVTCKSCLDEIATAQNQRAQWRCSPISSSTSAVISWKRACLTHRSQR